MALLLISACGGGGEWSDSQQLVNAEAVVPPQCYTRTEGRYNPCYVCHQTHLDRPNTMSDAALQNAYTFSEVALTNHWTNLFRDFSGEVAKISDAHIDTWVAEENYSGLAKRLRNKQWQGYIPDLNNLHLGAAAFDAQGFARDDSGWLTFNYKPLPSTFWPLNGATDDVMIRLPPRYRRNASNQDSRETYRLNLALLEAAIKNLDTIPISATDEREIGRDLDGDGALTPAVTHLLRSAHYLGAAEQEPVTPFLYPEGTEFLHTVRYLGVAADERITVTARLKEVRYMRKHHFLSQAELNHRYYAEKREKIAAVLPSFVRLQDRGFDNGFGWEVIGFIEDQMGELRPQTYEENFFCMGCHSTVGATIDQTFAFPRKLTGPAGWTYSDLGRLWDAPSQGEQQGEVVTYFQRVGGSDEFRRNQATLAPFLDGDQLDMAAVTKLSYAELLMPDAARARALNKAYLVLVREQSYIYGRDAHVTPTHNVYEKVDLKTAPTLAPEFQYPSDIRLDWRAKAKKPLP